MAEPWRFKRHESSISKETELASFLRSELCHNGHRFVVYRDGGYPQKDVLLTNHSSAFITVEQIDFIDQMKSVRLIVEWCFSRIDNVFSFLNFKKNLKLRLQLVKKYYLAGTLFFDIHTILNSNQNNFYLNPLSIVEYFNFYCFCLS